MDRMVVWSELTMQEIGYQDHLSKEWRTHPFLG